MGAERRTKTTNRRFFTGEIKQEAVALLESSGQPLMHVAQEPGIQPSVLHNWRRRVATPRERPQMAKQPAAATTASEQAAEIARLKRELERVRLERDKLKKLSRFSRAP